MTTPQSPQSPSRPLFDLGELLRNFGGLFLLTASLPSTARKALYRIMACRTEELGGHIERCDDCGLERQSYNSCGDRHCPKCQGSAGLRWVAERMATFLPCHYFHTVFTVPDLLRPVFLGNRALLFTLLFQSVSETLLELSADPRWFGAQPGFTLVLHTWTKSLEFHPHLHGVITGGGLVGDGLKWKPSRAKYLFPKRVMSKLFRGKFLAGLKKLNEQGALQFSGGQEHLARPGEFERLLHKLYTRNWVVYAKAPFSSPEYVYRYLSRYTHRVGLTNRRILEASEESVRLQTRGEKSVVLKLPEFFRRFTLHILPDGFRRIRHYGLMSSTNRKTRLEQARALLTVGAPACETSPNEATSPGKEEMESCNRCPQCGSDRIMFLRQIDKYLGPLFERVYGMLGKGSGHGAYMVPEGAPP